MPVKFVDAEVLHERESDLKREDLQNLKEWAESQAHLPKLTDVQLIIFFHSCYYSNEATKECIDNYYTARALWAECFTERNPTSKELQVALKACFVTALPKPTPEGYTILYNKLNDRKPDHFMFYTQLKVFDMALSLLQRQEGTVPGYLIVIDLEGATLSHLLRVSIMAVKKYMFFLQEALPVRLKGFHFINCVSFMDKILALMKPFMKKELNEILFLHQGSLDSIYDTIPKDLFPNELGGKAGSLKDIHKNTITNIMDNVDFFITDELEKADETKREGKPKNAGDVFGVEGTFKKLDID